ncbi:MAG TPA: alginate export family protein [Polyangiaceae bacterium]|nr:alginate export family protein [Polyangiaceae bacterium]
MIKVPAIGVALSMMATVVRANAQVSPPAPETLALGDWLLAPVLDVRAYGDYRHDLDDQDRGILIERSRLGLDGSRGAVEGRVVLQDARVLLLSGTAPVEGPLPVALVGAYEAWVEGHTASAHPSFVRVGRQPVVWGEGRLLGVSDWSPTGRSLDAVRGRLAFGDGAVELLAAALEDDAQGTALPETPYGELFGARGEWAFDPLLAAEAYVLARLAQFNPAYESGVEGQTGAGAARLHGAGQGWSWAAEGVLEVGHVDGAARGQSIFTGPRTAWAVAARLGRTLSDVALRPDVGLGAAYASGDRGGRVYTGFDPLLPDVHEWHGAMDVFSWSNEAEASARVAAAAWSDGGVSVEYRYARLAQPGAAWESAYLLTLGQAPGNAHASLGHEIDAGLAWSPWVPVHLQAGYSVLFLGDGAQAALRANFGAVPSVSQFAFAQARVGF